MHMEIKRLKRMLNSHTEHEMFGTPVRQRKHHLSPGNAGPRAVALRTRKGGTTNNQVSMQDLKQTWSRLLAPIQSDINTLRTELTNEFSDLEKRMHVEKKAREDMRIDIDKRMKTLETKFEYLSSSIPQSGKSEKYNERQPLRVIGGFPNQVFKQKTITKVTLTFSQVLGFIEIFAIEPVP